MTQHSGGVPCLISNGLCHCNCPLLKQKGRKSLGGSRKLCLTTGRNRNLGQSLRVRESRQLRLDRRDPCRQTEGQGKLGVITPLGSPCQDLKNHILTIDLLLLVWAILIIHLRQSTTTKALSSTKAGRLSWKKKKEDERGRRKKERERKCTTRCLDGRARSDLEFSSESDDLLLILLLDLGVGPLKIKQSMLELLHFLELLCHLRKKRKRKRKRKRTRSKKKKKKGKKERLQPITYVMII